MIGGRVPKEGIEQGRLIALQVGGEWTGWEGHKGWEEGSGSRTLLVFLRLPGACLTSEGKRSSLFPLSHSGEERLPPAPAVPLLLAASICLPLECGLVSLTVGGRLSISEASALSDDVVSSGLQHGAPACPWEGTSCCQQPPPAWACWPPLGAGGARSILDRLREGPAYGSDHFFTPSPQSTHIV